WTCVALAVAGFVASLFVPRTGAADPALKLDWNPLRETLRNFAYIRSNRTVFLSILGISWFWLYGALFLSQLPDFAKSVLHGSEITVTVLLAVFSVGVGIGSLLCERLSGRKVEIGLVPFGSIGLTVFALDLWLATRHMSGAAAGGLGAFLAEPAPSHVIADSPLLRMLGVVYIAPPDG